ncbi:cation transporting ATPase, putative [Babesia bigemina]|uniref:Cation transporting ATPase, putative n=1 Tax=Babesia bigemina TaxID=5866 RepID=A0A061D647_BABBI|nr:cation transporting ATPase, putative [Babesia bigemina]CDR96033.1 cation transporting ATPase, putative [Babesia bigemina]|eukprot:XP_012768219.1 cation transporting ATPase, putative [Babesia bigemina]
MAQPDHTRRVFRYVGRHAAFAQFSIAVLGIALAAAALHFRKIWALFSKPAEEAAESVAEGEVKVIRVDYAAIAARLRAMDTSECFLLVLFVVVCLVAAAMLLSLWYIPVRLFLFYESCPFVEGSDEYREYVLRKGTHVYIIGIKPSADSTEERRAIPSVITQLLRSKLYSYYTHGHRKYVLNERSCEFEAVEHIDSVDVKVLEAWRGLSAKDKVSTRVSGIERSLVVCEDTFGDNDYQIPPCDFWKMLFDAFLSPFFLFQLLASILWIFDSYWYYSCMTIFSIITIEVQMVKKNIREYDRINSMRIPPADVLVYRDGKWTTISSAQLYPGDIFLLTHDAAAESTVVRADCLILSGEVVVDESILTGESVPQFKSALDLRLVRSQKGALTEADSEMRQSTVFAGTSIMLCRADGQSFGAVKPPKQGCVCVVLRTGFESYQGRLVNAIIRSGDRVTASNTEGWCFLAILLTFALVSCTFVVRRLPTATLKKLILTTLHIITAVIPPEFSVILSLAVSLAILQLHGKGMYCTEPFRVPYAGDLGVCAFDKTGTLTEDQMKVVGVVVGNDVSSLQTQPGQQAQSAPLPIASALVVGGCHSLSRVSGNIVGDPMEKAAFEHFGWTLSADNKSVEGLNPWFYESGKKLAPAKVTVLRRWQFVSELGRMSTIAVIGGRTTYWQKPLEGAQAGSSGGNSHQSASTELKHGEGYLRLDNSYDGDVMLLCKGAPERVRPLLREVPEYYDELYQQLAIGGMRVLTLACRKLPITPTEVPSVVREEVESSLEFVGFLALESPIRSSSVICMRQLDGHKLIMITGDNVLTACHVADAVEMGDRSNVDLSTSARKSWGDFAILVPEEGGFCWRLRNGNPVPRVAKSGDFVDHMNEIKQSMRLCVTGPAIDALVDYERRSGRKVLAEIVLNTTVFARVSPQQKKFVVRTFKRAGMKTAMCGDGTNDMAALKVAHVGISLLKSAFKKPHKELTNKLGDMIRKQPHQLQREALEKLQRDLQDGMPELKLGEASIASPFTYRKNDVLCVPLLVRSGRCALTTVVLLHKVMGVNSLITSLGMSVLSMDGVGLSEAQATVSSLMYTFMLMALSKSKPAQEHSSKRPEKSIFRPASFTSFVLQCCLHVSVILHLWGIGKSLRAPDYVPNLDAPFAPNIVNTVIYYGCLVISIAGFLSNYRGYPYMQPLWENKFLSRPLAAAALFVLVLASDLFRPLNDYLSLVEIPNHTVRLHVIAVLAIDILGAVAIERLCRRLLSRS